MSVIIYRKPQSEIDTDIQSGLIRSEYAVIRPSNGVPVDACMDAVPVGATEVRVANDSDVPASRVLRDAWDDSNPESFVGVNMTKARELAHIKRRECRAKEFAPHDEVIMKQIPGIDAVAAEAARQAIRDKYAVIQSNIDGCQTPDAVITMMESLIA